MQFKMDDQYRMIEQNIESLLDDNQDQDAVMPVPMEETPVTTRPDSFLPYKCLEIASKEGPILGQYTKWSTVESDELNVQHHTVDQSSFSSPPMPVPAYTLTVELMQNILLNFLNAQMLQNLTMTKRTCSFCKKNGMSFATYTSHSLRVNGILQCPFLLKCQCCYCLKNGHTTSYCPMKDRTTASLTSSFFDRSPVHRF